MGYCFKRKIRIAIKSIDGPWNCLKQLSYWIDSSLLCSLLCCTRLCSAQATLTKKAQCFCEYAILSIQFENVMYRLKYYFIPYNSKTYRIHSEQHQQQHETVKYWADPTDRQTERLNIFSYVQTLTASQTVFFFCSSIFLYLSTFPSSVIVFSC